MKSFTIHTICLIVFFFTIKIALRMIHESPSKIVLVLLAVIVIQLIVHTFLVWNYDEKHIQHESKTDN